MKGYDKAYEHVVVVDRNAKQWRFHNVSAEQLNLLGHASYPNFHTRCGRWIVGADRPEAVALPRQHVEEAGGDQCVSCRKIERADARKTA